MKKTLLCLLMIPLFANAKETLGVGEYRYGPDTTKNFACQAAEEKAKEHAITRYVGEQIESIAYETCQNESCDMQKNTFNEVKGEIKTIISTTRRAWYFHDITHMVPLFSAIRFLKSS